MRRVAVVGAGMTPFGKSMDKTLKDLGRVAVEAAMKDAGVDKPQIEAAIVGNATAGLITGQEMIKAQVILREMGFGDIPMINTENACASSSTAFHLAWLYVASGMYDCVLALGVEKLYHEDKRRSFQAIGSAVDMTAIQDLLKATAARGRKDGDQQGASAEGAGEKRSMFMDFYAAGAREHMKRYGTTAVQFAKVAVKSHYNASLNPYAQYRETYSVEDILNSPMVAEPLTRLMCSPIGDGAAALVLCSEEKARQLTTKPVWVTASILGSGKDRAPGEPGVTTRMANKAYAMAGLGPDDIDVIELHDASAPAELMEYEELGLCKVGEGGKLIEDGVTALDGKIPVNPSGGLLSKGHPIGATGCAQLTEIVWQLRGEAGERQVKGGNAKVGLTQNGGGMMRGEAAAICVHILQR
ncbi:MAG TPA: thiolase family protein [Dehalococcoidia bacterium]|nr:thiolase family protein [Dehalococcoidia bacterium]